MLPRVILHNAVSVDGRIDWFTPDIGQFYSITSCWEEEATLAGCDTLLQSQPDLQKSGEDDTAAEPPAEDPDDGRPILVVPDSRGRIRGWHLLRQEPYWRDVVVLCSRSTPREYLDHLDRVHVDNMVCGDERVDLRAALEELNARYGVAVVRVDSGGSLNGVLLRAGLVDEVSVLISPCLVGGQTSRSLFRAPDLTSSAGVIGLKLSHVEQLTGEVVWLRYEIVR